VAGGYGGFRVLVFWGKLWAEIFQIQIFSSILFKWEGNK